MIVRGPRPQGNFYILDKTISEDVRLSWAARGLLIFLLGKPDHWQVSPAALVNETRGSAKPLGRDGVYALLSELIAAGYVTRAQARKRDGSLGAVTYTVAEAPLPAQPDTVGPIPGQPRPADPTQARIEEKQGLKGKQGSNDDDASRDRAGEPTFNPASGTFEGLTPEVLSRWVEAFPAVDVPAEVQRAAAWRAANPDCEGSASKFLVNWMARAQDRAARKASPGKGEGRRSATDERADWMNRATGRVQDERVAWWNVATGRAGPDDGGDIIDVQAAWRSDELAPAA